MMYVNVWFNLFSAYIMLAAVVVVGDVLDVNARSDSTGAVTTVTARFRRFATPCDGASSPDSNLSSHFQEDRRLASHSKKNKVYSLITTVFGCGKPLMLRKTDQTITAIR